MREIVICDFNDSFTLNIFAEVKLLFPEVEVNVINHQDLLALSNLDSKLVILGPGPGHPEEYFHILKFLKDNIKNEKFRFFGICLGHQLIWKALGASIERSIYPVHGQTVSLEGFKGVVQRYNSLAVYVDQESVKEFCDEYVFDQNELVLSKGLNFISYQFHPESVGTTCPDNYFKPLEKLLI